MYLELEKTSTDYPNKFSLKLTPADEKEIFELGILAGTMTAQDVPHVRSSERPIFVRIPISNKR